MVREQGGSFLGKIGPTLGDTEGKVGYTVGRGKSSEEGRKKKGRYGGLGKGAKAN